MRVSLDPAAKDVFQWAAPVLETGISLIEDGHLYYCGIPIEQVAMMFSAEELASLVWTENAANAHALFDSGRHPSVKKYRKKLLDLGIDRDSLFSVPSFQIILPIAMADDPIAFDLREESIVLSGARILRLLTSLAAGDVAEDISLAEMLQRGWQPHDERSIRFFNMALIICADHQVKLATFFCARGSCAGYDALLGHQHRDHRPRGTSTRRIHRNGRSLFGRSQNAG